MNAQLTVSAERESLLPGAIAEVVASLPISLSYAGGRADLVAVAGSPGWTERCIAAIAAGCRGILVIDPVNEDVAALERIGSDRGVPVVLDSRWTHNPGITVVADKLHKFADEGAPVESLVIVPPESELEATMLAHLALIAAAVGQMRSIRLLHRGVHGYRALAQIGRATSVSLAGVFTAAKRSSASIRIISPKASVELTVPAPVDASASVARLHMVDSTTTYVTPYENSHRAAWRRLIRAVHERRTSDDLSRFKTVGALMDRLTVS